MRNVKAIIIGPPETPYEFGFFEVCQPYAGSDEPVLTFFQFAVKFGRGTMLWVTVRTER